ncbi:MAG: hypothetical protein R3C49_07940 [Planctomycetaceae bacterium]
MTSGTGFRFHLDATDSETAARTGRWETPHGVVETPAFMPVELWQRSKEFCPSNCVRRELRWCCRAYHLALRRGGHCS